MTSINIFDSSNDNDDDVTSRVKNIFTPTKNWRAVQVMPLEIEEEETNKNFCFCFPEVQLSWKIRVLFWLVCFCLGTGLNMIATNNVGMIITHPSDFAWPFTAGNILSLLSTTFLIGPGKQCSSMFQKNRALASLVYMSSMILTLVSAFIIHNSMLTVFFCATQSLSFFWYCLSYIPYAHDCILSFFGRCKPNVAVVV